MVIISFLWKYQKVQKRKLKNPELMMIKIYDDDNV